MSEDIFQSKTFKVIILGLGGLIILVLVFDLGVFVGSKRADFSFQWADEYHRNFGGPQGGFFGDFIGTEKELPNANGSFGQIIQINQDADNLTIKDSNNLEKNILVTDKTMIVSQKNNIKFSDLKIGESVVVVGNPNNSGQIISVLIRAMPPVAPK